MIEGVNTSIAQASLTQGTIISATEANLASEASRASITNNQPRFISRFIAFDQELNTTIFQIRNSETGEVERTIPSDAQIQAYQRALSGSTSIGFIPLSLQNEVSAARASADQVAVQQTQDTQVSSDVSTEVVAQEVEIEAPDAPVVRTESPQAATVDPASSIEVATNSINLTV